MKTYIIHMSTAIERTELVKAVVDLTGAEIFEAIHIKGNGVAGCLASHMTIFKSLAPDEDVLVFEDDCEIVDPTFTLFIENNKHLYDIIYIGTNRTFDTPEGISSWGTHAMWISANAIRVILNHTPVRREIDNIWNEIEHKYKLAVWRPAHPYQYVIQKEGLLSSITGKPRKSISFPSNQTAPPE